MKGVIYARYSSENQREESIDGQLRECTAYAERNGITILGTYIDRALSAKTDNRPDFQRMIRDSSKNMFDTILVWKLDRFARNRYDSAYYKHLLKKNNVKVVSATEAISQGAEGIILESVLEGMAEYYSAELAEKVTRGMTENALKCKYNGGTVPVGYNITKDKHYEIDPLTAPLVLEVFTLYKDGKTMKEIVDFMNAKGFRTKKGGKTNLNSISRLLQNRHYIGEYHYKDIVTPGGIPAIVPIELFDAVQERLKTNKKAPAKHKAEDDYFLTTKIFCADCKSPMAGESGTSHTSRKYHYYKCSNAKRHKGCKRRAIRKDWIEDEVLTYAKSVLEDDEYIENLISSIISESKKDNTLLPMLKRELSEVDKRIRNMLDAIQDGIYTSSTKQRLEELEARKEDIEVQLAMEELGRTKINEDMLYMWFNKMKSLDITSLDYKRMFFDAFVNSVYVMDNGIEIALNYKEGTKIITFDEIKKFYNEGSDLSPPARPNKDFNHKIGVFIFLK
ncbi:MAG: recombinase family protein [Clostridia bacterium]|nr:recombinase family protein [Clostridia bacterium]